MKLIALLSCLPLVAGCASDDSTGADSGGASATDDSLHGGVVVSFVPPADGLDGYATLIGRFLDGPTPQARALELDSEIGDCQLLVPIIPFCSTPCAPDVCTADEVCTKYPTPRSVGTLTVDGLGSPLTLEPASSMIVYQSPSLPYPPCAEGSTVSAAADGLKLEAECIAPLELTGPDPIPVTSGEVVSVSWVAPTSSTTSRIQIGLDISHHGGQKGEIKCNVPDTGSFDIPEPLVTKLVSLGLAGYPTISVNRLSTGVAAGHPHVELVLTAGVTRAVDTGVTSCQENDQCADGQMCLPERICG